MVLYSQRNSKKTPKLVRKPNDKCNSFKKPSKRQHPSYTLLEPKGFSKSKYLQYKNHCLNERLQRGPGNSTQMTTLFRFWSLYLRNHFSSAMYNEFKRIAIEDSDLGFDYGMQCLFRFYSYGLEIKFRQDLFTDFQTLVLKDYNKKSLYGVEKLWAFLHFRKITSDLFINEELEEILSNVSSIQSFKQKTNFFHQ